MRTPDDKTIAFTFMSHPMRKLEMRWTVKLTFPPGSVAETMLPIAVTDGNGSPVAKATLDLFGRRTKIVDGKASISYSDFIAGKHAVPIWLHRKGMPPVPGGPTFA